MSPMSIYHPIIVEAKRKGGAAVRRVRRDVIPGIVADARALSVSRMHLWAVLSGRRESAPLLRRYAALKGVGRHEDFLPVGISGGRGNNEEGEGDGDGKR